MIQEVRPRNLDFPNLHFIQYRIAFLERDQARMEHELDLLLSKPGFEP
jgi:hypothetical protein